MKCVYRKDLCRGISCLYTQECKWFFITKKETQTPKMEKTPTNEWTSAKNKCPWTVELVFMAQSPTIFNFLPAGNHTAITVLAKRSRVNASAAAGSVWCGSCDSLSLPMQAGLAEALMSSFPACSAARGSLCKRWNTQLREQPWEPSYFFCEKLLSCRLKTIFCKKIFFPCIFTLDIVLAYKAREIAKLINKSWTPNKQNCF